VEIFPLLVFKIRVHSRERRWLAKNSDPNDVILEFYAHCIRAVTVAEHVPSNGNAARPTPESLEMNFHD
jgi:hypothetical protein